MPKDHQKRTLGYASSVKLVKQFATPDSQHVERVEIGCVSANNLPAHPRIDKPQKAAAREALLERLALKQSPYSKSHLRRVKRKAHEQLANGLNDMQTALDESLDSSEAKVPTPPDGGSHKQPGTRSTSKSTPKTISGQIGEGKGATLSSQQRKRVLQAERMRHPLILSNSHFSSNPFQTLRTHAENTLVKRTPPES